MIGDDFETNNMISGSYLLWRRHVHEEETRRAYLNIAGSTTTSMG